VSYLNFDMVGRLTSDLIIQGLGSSPDWTSILDEASAGIDLSVVRQQDSYLPTDATSFYTQGVPVLSAFTGVHSEYHTPRDTADKLNLDATVQIGELFSRIAQSISRKPAPPIYQAQKAPAAGQGRGGFRVFLGTIPDYAQTDVVGVRLSGVAPGGPAEAAGLRQGDIIIEVDGRAIENLYDYTFALEALRVGVPASLSAFRAGERVQFEVVPTSRD
jgi:C-terminal processing protease CtpA/Prc